MIAHFRQTVQHQRRLRPFERAEGGCAHRLHHELVCQAVSSDRLTSAHVVSRPPLQCRQGESEELVSTYCKGRRPLGARENRA